FCHEAILWQRLRHKNVLPFLGIDNTSFSPHLCMMSPWMRNGNVLDYIRAARPGYVDVVRLLAEIAEGLAYLHSEHVIHGDVRGVNVLVDDQGHAMLADFGLAKISSNTATAHTTKGHGAPNWLSPELLQPKEGFHRTTASDVYSLACLGLELFTGKPPFADIRPPVNVALMVLKGEQPKRP
ncbi:kinase-like protein, partial [Punctularia strigosozonata HHB-11173 SS5]